MAALNPPIHSGFIANTDFGWFSHFLHRAEPPDEVDFWQPSPRGFKAIPPGAPFFFRLGAPHKAIAGFGFFARPPQVLTVADESYKKLLSCAPSLRGGGISSGSRWQR